MPRRRLNKQVKKFAYTLRYRGDTMAQSNQIGHIEKCYPIYNSDNARASLHQRVQTHRSRGETTNVETSCPAAFECYGATDSSARGLGAEEVAEALGVVEDEGG